MALIYLPLPIWVFSRQDETDSTKDGGIWVKMDTKLELLIEASNSML